MKPEWILAIVGILQVAHAAYSWHNQAQITERLDQLKDWIDGRYQDKRVADERHDETQRRLNNLERRHA